MDDRKKQVLCAIITDYIATAEPVGSRAVAKKYNLGVSPATIRNVMSDLEELGYIEQPHTSAGRKPSDKGYRYYVDCLMEKEQLSDEEMSTIHAALALGLRQADQFMRQCCQIISKLTNYTTLMILPNPTQGRLERLQLLPVNEIQVLLVIISNLGQVRHRLLNLPEPLTRQQISHLEAVLQENLRGVEISQLSGILLRDVIGAVNRQQQLLAQTMDLMEQVLLQQTEETVFSAGAFTMLNQPEFKDVDKIKNIFSLLEEENKVKEMFPQVTAADGVQVAIGEEMKEEEVKDCSMVVSTYGAKGETYGTIGILGPTRMSYAKTISLVEFIAAELSDLLRH